MLSPDIGLELVDIESEGFVSLCVKGDNKSDFVEASSRVVEDVSKDGFVDTIMMRSKSCPTTRGIRSILGELGEKKIRKGDYRRSFKKLISIDSCKSYKRWWNVIAIPPKELNDYQVALLLFALRFRCVACKVTSTPQWRKGWHGLPLCNACGLKFQKNQYCDYCFAIYGGKDFDPSIWVRCEKCGRASHVKCIPEEYNNRCSLCN